jgi:hypothetical protein
MAFKDHGSCMQCNHRIEAGDKYEASVMVIERKLCVHKYHVICPYEWFREEEERVRQQDEQHERSLSEQSRAA